MMIKTEEQSLSSELDDWGLDSDLVKAQIIPIEETGPANVGHVVDFQHRYPGEIVTLYTRVVANESLPANLTLRISLPEGLALDDYSPPAEFGDSIPYVETDNQINYLVWSLEEELPVGVSYQYQAQATVQSVLYNTIFKSKAVLTTQDHVVLAEETANIAVWAKGRYLRHLPELYEQDEFMGRFLMLFESFWAPIETQVGAVPNYFDPRITPTRLLPWLASWLDLDLDERWPEDKIRQLIRWAIALHRSRGTKWGLLKYLEIYTGQQAEVIEHRSSNFVIGPEAKLGLGMALGKGNVPHTFAVNLHLPPIEADDKKEQTRQEELRRRTIESIIDMQKPAHTLYTLNIETLLPDEKKAQADKADRQTKKSKSETDEIAAQAEIWFKLDD